MTRRFSARRHAGLFAWLLVLAMSASADTIVLTNGRMIEADRAWYEGSQVRYEKDGGIYGLPKSLVKSLDQQAAPPTRSPTPSC